MMENNDLAAGNEAEIAVRTEAVRLHMDIMAKGQAIADTMVEFCKGLKRMRDEKLYLALGYEDFGAYVEGAVGLRQRQAQYYISVLENLGESLLQSTAGSGIEKLKLLASVPGIEREDFVREHDLNDLTVKELRELTEKYNRQSEQLSLMETEKEAAQEYNARILGELQQKTDAEAAARTEAEARARKEQEKTKKMKEQLTREREAKEALERRVKELEAQPVEVPVEQFDIEELTRVRQEAEAAAERKYQERMEQADRELEEARQAAQEAQRRAGQAQAEARASGTGVQRAAFLVERVQKTLQELMEALEQAGKEDPDQGGKYRAAVARLLDIMKERVCASDAGAGQGM